MSDTLKLFDGPVSVYIKAYADVDNDPMSTENTVDWTDWTLLGYLMNANDQPVITIDGEVEEIKPGGYNTAIERVLVGESCKIATAVEQATLATLDFACVGGIYTAGAVAGTNPNEFSVGNGTPQVWSVGIEGYAASGEKVIVFVQRATAAQSFSATYKKGQNEIPFEFDALADTLAGTADGKRLIRIREITAV